MAFWSGERLKAEGRRLQVVYGFDPEKIDCSAYTLTLGPEAFVTPDYSIAARESVKKQLQKPDEVKVGRKKAKGRPGEVVIPAGQFALLLTEEFVKIPAPAMGFISLRFKIKGTGLINVSGFHVDPGYEGRLVFSVYNAGPNEINLTRGQDIFLLWLADLDRESKPPYIKSPPATLQAGIPEEMVSKANHRIRSLQQLSEIMDQIQKEWDFFKGIAKVIAVIVGIVISFMALTIAGVRFFGESPVVNPVDNATTENAATENATTPAEPSLRTNPAQGNASENGAG